MYQCLQVIFMAPASVDPRIPWKKKVSPMFRTLLLTGCGITGSLMGGDSAFHLLPVQ